MCRFVHNSSMGDPISVRNSRPPSCLSSSRHSSNDARELNPQSSTVSGWRSAIVAFVVASRTQSDQVGLHILPLMTTQLFVMYLQITSRAADLASPAVPLQYLLPQLQVATRV